MSCPVHFHNSTLITKDHADKIRGSGQSECVGRPQTIIIVKCPVSVRDSRTLTMEVPPKIVRLGGDGWADRRQRSSSIANLLQRLDFKKGKFSQKIIFFKLNDIKAANDRHWVCNCFQHNHGFRSGRGMWVSRSQSTLKDYLIKNKKNIAIFNKFSFLIQYTY